MAVEGGRGMQVVVAGASGFIGQRLVREALAQGHDVFALMRVDCSATIDWEPDSAGSLTTLPWGADPEVLEQGFSLPRGAWVINAAGLRRERPGLDPDKVHETICNTVVELAEALEASRLVHLGPLQGRHGDAFSRGKALMERRVQESKVPWSIVRSAPVYGPGDELLDGIGVWMASSPLLPRFLEAVPLQPLWVGDLATGLLRSREGVQEVGGERILWGELLEKCAEAAGKRLMGPVLPESTILRFARTFGHRSLFTDLVPFTEAGVLRHSHGYEVAQNDLPGMLGGPPRSLEDYLRAEWPYRYKK
ncbi:MAG: NAD(P)H-binding protein [Holophagaceae bacterium]|nr:NAD(P)H-binding protein [Holophagaceae bacterium]